MIAIREMQLDDLSQVMAIEEENFSTPWTETGFFSFFMREDALFLVAESESEVVAYTGVLMVLDEADILNVAVKGSCQGTGIGKQLLNELVAVVGKAGIKKLHLEVRESNQRALGLYERIGFERINVRKNYYEAPTEDGIVMCREINI